MADLEGLLGRHVTPTRQILRKLLVGRLVCQPFDDGRRRGYRFTGTVSYERMLPAEAIPRYVVTPAGLARLWSVERVRILSVKAA